MNQMCGRVTKFSELEEEETWTGALGSTLSHCNAVLEWSLRMPPEDASP